MEFSILPRRKVIFASLFFIQFFFGLWSCDAQNAGGTEVESDIADLTIFANGTPLRSAEVEVYALQSNYPQVASRLSTDSLGQLFLPDSLINNPSYVIFDQDSSTAISLWHWLIDSSKTVHYEKDLVIQIVVQSESIYGGGEADSALFIVNGTPLWIPCGIEPKWVNAWPRQAQKLRIENKIGVKYDYNLPNVESSVDTLYMSLIEQSLVIEPLGDTLQPSP